MNKLVNKQKKSEKQSGTFGFSDIVRFPFLAGVSTQKFVSFI